MRHATPALWTFAVCVFPIAGALAQTNPDSPPTHATETPASSHSSPPRSPAPVKSADAIPQQIIWLRSGAIIRGEIVEYVPNSHVILQLATGELRTVAWADVARASWVNTSSPSRPAAFPPPPASSAPPSPQTTPKAASSAGVLLHLDGDRPGLRIEARPRYGPGRWTSLCQAPCGVVLDVHRKSLRVAGNDTRPSNPFHIGEQVGEETLAVSAGSQNVHRWGQRSLVAGIGLALAGGLAYGLGRVEDEDAAVVGGIVGLALGGIGIAVALPLLGSSATVVRNGEGDRVGVAARRRLW